MLLIEILNGIEHSKACYMNLPERLAIYITVYIKHQPVKLSVQK